MGEYLAPSNWDKRQPGRRGKSEWIKDYTDKDGHEKYMPLTFFERQTLDGIRRFRGRTGENIPNDVSYIASSLHAARTDRSHLRHAVSRLIADGLLVITNQAVDSVGQPQIKSKKESKKREEKPSASAEPRGSVKPTDPRFQHCVDILHRYWDRFINGKVRFEVWMDRAGYKQLQNSLKRSEALTVEDFTRCVANRARSPGVDHGEPAYKWLGHVTEWAGGPKGKSNGNGTYKTAAATRTADNVEALVRSSVGAGVQRNDAADGRTIQHPVDGRRRREEGSVASDSVLAGEPAQPKPDSDA